jgi:hypothetical protein
VVCARLPSGLDEVCREWDLTCDFFWVEVLCARLVIAMAPVDFAFGGIEQLLGASGEAFCALLWLIWYSWVVDPLNLRKPGLITLNFKSIF